MSKAVAPHDTELDSGRELTNSNLSAVRRPFREKKVLGLYRLKLVNRRISLDRKSGQAFLDPETFTKSHRLDFHSGKTFDRSILRVKTRDSPRTVPTGERPQKKRGVGILFSRRESAVRQKARSIKSSLWRNGTVGVSTRENVGDLSGVLCAFDQSLDFCQF